MMLKGLAVRQIFVLVDLVLACALMGVAFWVIAKVLEQPAGPVASAVSPGNATAPTFSVPADRSAYDIIEQSGIFGAAGRLSAETAPLAPLQAEIKETTAPLRLWGTVTAGSEDPLATAIIENTKTKRTATYYLGQLIIDPFVLKAVRKREAILFNQATNGEEILRMDDAEDRVLVAEAGSPVVRPAQPDPPAAITVGKQELAEELMNYRELVEQVNPELYRDENGNVAGITSAGLDNVPLAQKLGLQNNDVVQTVNGVRIDSQERIAEIINRFKDLSTFRVGILRDGKPKMITYTLE